MTTDNNYHRYGATRRDVYNVRMAGIATLWLVLTFILLVAFVAMAVDVIFVTVIGRQLSAGADAAALAGVAEVRRSRSDARDQAWALAAANTVNTDTIQIDRNDANISREDGGDVVIGVFRRSDGSFTPIGPGEGLPNAVQVTAARTDDSLGGPMTTIFASIDVNVERFATAMILGDVGPGVIALDPSSQCSMDMRGTSGTFTVTNGVMVVNSNNAQAACHSGQPTLDVEEVYVVGGTDNKFEDQVDLSGELILDADPVPDPLEDLPEPNEPGNSIGNVSINNGTHTLSPGSYSNLSITGGDITFEAGLYYFTGQVKITGGDVDATAGVMLFIAPGGSLEVRGNGSFEIVGMNPTVYPNGPTVPASVANIRVPIFQSHRNTNEADINGTPNWQMTGTIYVPSGKVTVEGTPGTFANGLIAAEIETRGNADLNIDFQGQFPPLPRKVFLVE